MNLLAEAPSFCPGFGCLSFQVDTTLAEKQTVPELWQLE